ncbi:hypothetical protein HN51_035865, partial [Arachis hypogaea]
MQSNVKISIFVGSIIGTNMELQEAKLIVQKWRFGSWPDGVYSLGKLVLKEPEPGVTVVKLTHNDVLEEDIAQIAFNSIQRHCVKVSVAESIPVTRFMPPENFDLIGAPQLSKQLQKRFANQ